MENQTPAAMSYAPQSAPPSRFLHIYVEGRGVTIFDSDQTTPVYIVNSNRGGLFSSKPHMRICRPPTPSSALETQIGSASFHTWGSTVDLKLGSSTAFLKSKGLFTQSTKFQSSVGPLTWQHESPFGMNLRLVNAEGHWLAQFEGSTFSWNKRRKLEIAGGVQGGPGLLDEIVISGLAMLVVDRRKQTRNNAVAAGASAGAAGALSAGGGGF